MARDEVVETAIFTARKVIEDQDARIAELESIIRAKDGFLQELYAQAGFRTGEQVSVLALIERIRTSN